MALVKLGDKAETSVIRLNENGTLVEFYVCAHNYESGLNGPGRVLVVRKDAYDDRQFHSGRIKTYEDCDLDIWFNNGYKSLLDPEIQAAMGTTKIYCTRYSNPNKQTVHTGYTLNRAVFTLSCTELGKDYFSGLDEGTALSSAVISAIKGVHYWTRSPEDSAFTDYTGTTQAVYGAYTVLVGGSVGGVSGATRSLGARPAFTLPADLWVTDDGTVTTNTAPTAPSTIAVPAQVNGGSTVTVSWGTSADAEDNLEGYKVERSLDGGTTWSQIYQGGGTSAANTVPFGSESVMYRVKAYDAEGLESGWKTSAQATVINNTAPTVPGSITVPEAVQGGQPLAVSWGASSDGENNLAGYSLERQVDGGEWAAVYSGTELSFTDQITKGWQTVAYRVRAYDTANAYSGFAVSEARQVNNNTPPVITCATASGTNLGVKSEGFAVPYSVADEEGDDVTVTEAVDGAAWRTFTATLGGANSFQLTGEGFMKLLNGPHTLTIAADDGASGAAHSLSFTKAVTAASVTLDQPMEADGPISVCVLAVSGFIPADADFSVEATNNAKDATPVWEDCTAATKAGANHVFTNQTAANGPAFNFRLNVERGPSGQGGFISSVQGGFQGA